MSDAVFVPVLPVSSKARIGTDNFRLAVTPQADKPAAFVPAASPAAAHPGAAHAHPSGEPVISLEKQGDRVTRITVRCTCGHVIELDCAY